MSPECDVNAAKCAEIAAHCLTYPFRFKRRLSNQMCFDCRGGWDAYAFTPTGNPCICENFDDNGGTRALSSRVNSQRIR